MSLEKLKLKSEDIASTGVCAAPDKLTGSAAENKAVFDRLIRESLAQKYNELIDRLGAMDGVNGVQSDTIRYIRIGEGRTLQISYDGKEWITVGGGGGGGGAGGYTLPVASADTLGGVKIGAGLASDEEGVLSATGGGDLPDGDEVSY